jgi:hypothetical protein
MIWQLRTYRIKPGLMDEFRELWRNHVIPARTELGFTVAGGWYDEEEGVFVWLVGHEAPDGWEAAERSYYESPRREEFPSNPADFVAGIETRLLREA